MRKRYKSDQLGLEANEPVKAVVAFLFTDGEINPSRWFWCGRRSVDVDESGDGGDGGAEDDGAESQSARKFLLRRIPRGNLARLLRSCARLGRNSARARVVLKDEASAPHRVLGWLLHAFVS